MLWGVVGLFLIARRYSGAFSQSLSVAALVGCAVVMVAAAALIRKLWLTACAGEVRAFEWLLPTVALAMTAFAISVPRTSTAGLVVFWSLLVIGESAWLWRLVSNRSQTSESQSAASVEHQDVLVEITPTEHSGLGIFADSEEETESPEELDPNVIQQLVRSCDENGNESMAGKIRLKIAAGQQAGRVHIAFSPPFPKPPEVYIEPRPCEVEFQARLSKAFAHGARIDVRLDSVAESQATIWLEVFAVSS